MDMYRYLINSDKNEKDKNGLLRISHKSSICWRDELPILKLLQERHVSYMFNWTFLAFHHNPGYLCHPLWILYGLHAFHSFFNKYTKFIDCMWIQWTYGIYKYCHAYNGYLRRSRSTSINLQEVYQSKIW